MPRQDHWENEQRRYLDETNRDWREAADEGRRGDPRRESGRQDRFMDRDRFMNQDRFNSQNRFRRQDQDQLGDYGRGRDQFDPSEAMRRRDTNGYGGANRDPWQGGYGEPWRGERGFFERASDEVASWFGDRDAERRRDEDQHRGKGPKGYQRSDDRIREDVNDRLTDDPFVDAGEIEVAVSSAEVTLTGFVRDRDQRRRAEDAAERVSGVIHVQNNIRIKTSADNAATTIGDRAFGRDTSTGDLTGKTGSASIMGSTQTTDPATPRKTTL